MEAIKFTEGDLIGDMGVIFIKDIRSAISPGGQKKRICLFKCPCRKNFEARLANIKNNGIKNCGCGINGKRQKHGLTGNIIRKRWVSIKARCTNPNHQAYKNYGGRGITLYEGWLHNPTAFIEYIKSLPNYGNKGLTLDRINNDKGYEPGNLRWATRREQRLNSRSKKEKHEKAKAE